MSDLVKLSTRVSPEIRSRLDAYVASENSTVQAVTNEAFERFLIHEDYKSVSLKYLAEIEKKQQIALKRMDVLLETMGKFAFLYLLHTPPTPEEPEIRQAAKRFARERYEKFLKSVADGLKSSSAFKSIIEERVAKLSDFTDYMNRGGE